MTNPTRGSRRPQPATHLFQVGQTVRMTRRFGYPPGGGELFRVTGLMPARDDIAQYRIRNDGERHERVASEDSLEASGPQAAGGA